MCPEEAGVQYTYKMWKHASHHFCFSLIASFIGIFLQSQNYPSGKGHAETQTLAQLHFWLHYAPLLPEVYFMFGKRVLCNPPFLVCYQNYCSYSISWHGITECPGLGGTLNLILFQPPCDEQGHLHQTWLLRAPSNLALNTAKHWTSTISLETLFQCLTIPRVMNFSLISNLNLLSFSWKPFPLFCHYTLL